MIKHKPSILIILAILLLLPVCAQTNNPQQIQLAERLHSLAKNSSPEVPYIQTSKDIYETGEDLWFKVYLLDAQYFIPSLMSKILYLQLLNENNKKVVWEEKYEIQNGTANGRIYLESTLPEGDYLLAAYTPNSFFNDTSEFKAVRRIKIKNEVTSQTITKQISDKPLLFEPAVGNANTFQFSTFPEGGDLIFGIESKLAYKAVSIKDEPIDIAGTLYEDITPLLKFKSFHAGMGSLKFKPIFGKKYTIRLSEPSVDSTFLLPDIHTEGMTLQLDERDKESIYLKVSQMPEVNQEDIYIRVQCRGVVYGLTMAKLEGKLMIKIPLADLPQGIAEVTLFNSKLVPVAERLVYLNYFQKLNIAAVLSKEIFATRGKATLKIIAKDENGKPVVANFGVTVFDKLYQNPQDSNNILTHYYLSSQLKGRIYNPSFYFNSNNKDRDEALDLLMLTQGWRKYVWNEMNLKKSGEQMQQVIFNGIKGEIINLKRQKMEKPLFVTAFSPNKDRRKLLIQADSMRKFIVPPVFLKAWEGDYVYLKPVGPPGTKPRIKLTDSFESINQIMKTKQITYPIPNLIQESDVIQTIPVISSGVTKIREVTIKGKKTNLIRRKYMGNLDSLSKLNLFFDPDDYVCSYGYLNCPACGRDSRENTKPENGKLYKFYTANGQTTIIRYGRPDFTEEQLLKMNNLSRVKAFFENREFYKPNYDEVAADSLLPDFRNNLLWEPSVITDENGEATLDFYSSDINTDFIGRIEGVSREGLLGVKDFKFTVRKMKINPY
ncbi:MAG: hypothetical protein WCS03_11845 [Bacteroidota bacterium]